MKKSRAYQPDLSESLRAREAEVYLNAALEEDDPELFLLALRNVAESVNQRVANGVACGAMAQNDC